MKILIFGLPRCGTVSLFSFLKASLPKTFRNAYEPFKHTTEVDWGENCIIKTVICDEIKLKDNESLFENSLRIIKQFDVVIYIKRKNIDNIKKSLADMYFKMLGTYDNYSYCVELANKNIDEWIKIFDVISSDKKIFYYEDLYQPFESSNVLELCNYLDIELDMKLYNRFMSPTKKESDDNWDLIKTHNSLL